MGTTETGTHTFILVFLRKHHQGEGMRCPFNLCYHIPTVFHFLFASLCPSHTDLLPNFWMGGDDPPADHSLNSPRACPRLRSAYWLAGSLWGGWQSGIEGSSLPPPPLLGGLAVADCPVARPQSASPPSPLLTAVSVGLPARERDFWLGWALVRWAPVGFSFLSHAHTHTQTHTHTCACVARLLFPTEQMGRRWTAEVWDFPNLGLGDYLNG